MTVGRETGGPISGTLAACQCQSSRWLMPEIRRPTNILAETTRARRRSF